MILIPPQVILIQMNMSTFDTSGYKNDGDLADDIENLKDYGAINKITGEFDFTICKNCHGPLFGHIETEDNCDKKTRAMKFKDGEAEILMDHFRNLTAFKHMMLRIDNRMSQTYCDKCDKRFQCRLDFIMHMESTHKIKINEQSVDGSFDSANSIAGLANVMLQQASILEKLQESA